MTGEAILKLKIQLYCGDEIAMGPGKADLLEAIRRCGSISAAGREMGMSYRRAWMLVDTLNRCWREPVVETSPGSARGGGAKVSAFGEGLLERYRMLQARIDVASDCAEFAALQSAMLPHPRISQKS
jgi:molybdate transport system regulatory protein